MTDSIYTGPYVYEKQGSRDWRVFRLNSAGDKRECVSCHERKQDAERDAKRRNAVWCAASK